MFTAKFQEWVRRTAARLVVAVRLRRMNPNVLTVSGLVVCAAAAVLIAKGWLVAGGIVLAVASLFDIIDGAVARASGKQQPYGAFLDSTVDRYDECFTYVALLYFFVVQDHAVVEPMLVISALGGSFLVSYVRARAQSLGFKCDGGLLARPERVVITVIGLIISPLLVWALWVLAVLTNATALQRIWIVWRQARVPA